MKAAIGGGALAALLAAGALFGANALASEKHARTVETWYYGYRSGDCGEDFYVITVNYDTVLREIARGFMTSYKALHGRDPATREEVWRRSWGAPPPLDAAARPGQRWQARPLGPRRPPEELKKARCVHVV